MSLKTFFSCCRAAWAELNETVWKVPSALGKGECHHCSGQIFGDNAVIWKYLRFFVWLLRVQPNTATSRCTLSCQSGLMKIKERKNIPPPPLLWWRDGRRQDDVRDSPLKSLHFRDKVKLFPHTGQAWSDNPATRQKIASPEQGYGEKSHSDSGDDLWTQYPRTWILLHFYCRTWQLWLQRSNVVIGLNWPKRHLSVSLALL